MTRLNNVRYNPICIVDVNQYILSYALSYKIDFITILEA